ncbi:glycosyltransferase involved in cell wall biosynthesis [Spirosoma lacussanchae]|uniref:glycosyltransferase family 2 protein n=1 Tax=Spirosoma lacussanchae TaxID=1884249 RepID=UPI0011081A10|nr:glycosyltransferase family A protein [Spirosoma lacussanchae]
MNHKKFTIVIPTRERADTLQHALRTCTTQDYDNLTILVSDNCSRDNTREVVESAGDPRVRYLNTGTRLSMSHNWEFALEHVQDGFVTYLGDDDGLLPNAVADSSALLNETGLSAINMNPNTDMYLWPSYFKKQQANMMKVSFQNGYEIRNGKTELQKLMRCEQEHSPIPCVYTSFIDMAVINQVKRVSTPFFRSQIPDSYSAVALANAIGDYVYAKRRLRLNGISSHSTGSSQFNYGTDQKAADLFASEASIPFHRDLIYSASYSYMIAENFLQSFDAGLNPDEWRTFDPLPFIETALKEANTRLNNQYDGIIAATRHFASKRGISTEAVNRMIDEAHTRTINIVWYDLQRYAHPFLFFNAATHGATNVYEASLLYQKIRENPRQFLLKGSTWRNMFQMVFGEVLNRYKVDK